MKSKLFLPLLVLFTLVVNSTAALAGQSGDWGAVQSIGAGEKVRVQLKDGKKTDGTLRGVTSTGLTVERNSNTLDYSRDSIARVYRVVKGSKGKSIAKSTAIGAGIGFGAGAGVGIAAGNYEDLDTGELIAILGGIGAAIGAGIGALIGSIGGGRDKRQLIYESR